MFLVSEVISPSLVGNVSMNGLAVSADCADHLILFRTHVSKNAAGKKNALLERLGFNADTIAECITLHPLNDVEAVQEGLKKWVGGKGKQPPTWQVLIKAMSYAEIAQQHAEALKKELGL